MKQNDAPHDGRSHRTSRASRRHVPAASIRQEAPATAAVQRFRSLLADLIAKRILADRHATSPADQPQAADPGPNASGAGTW